MTQTSKKLEEIPDIAFEIAEAMPEWYKCECDGNRTYYANKATKFFQKKVQSLLQEIREEVIGENEDERKWGNYSKDATTSRNQLKEQQRKALKSIEERYGI